MHAEDPLADAIRALEAGAHAAAEAGFRAALPGARTVHAWILLSRALRGQDRLEEAEAVLRGVPPVWRSQAAVLAELALVLREQARLEEAQRLQQAIVDAVPTAKGVRFQLAETLLLRGDMARGWEEYRFRYDLPHTVHLKRPVQKPRWAGEPIAGRTILVHDEQGFGDTLQFLRYIPMLKERGASVVLQVHPALLPLAARGAGADLVQSRADLPPRFDVYSELMTLPLSFGTRLDSIPAPVPYLHPLPERVAYWRQRLEGLPRPIVGLVWAGTPTHPNDAQRSMTLDALAPLADAAGSLVAVQMGPRADDADDPRHGIDVLKMAPEIRDFDDTAAILSVIDLLVTVDSAPAHLAGALGRPAWVLLPQVPDWRWLMEREDSPWYPGMRLFRQERRRDWAPVVASVAKELRHLRRTTE